MCIELVMPSKHLILYLLLPSIFPNIRVFSNEVALFIRWPKYWSFSFSINPSIEYPGLNSFRIDWFDLLEVQGTLKSLLQHHSSEESILQCSAFFMVQFSCPYMTTGKNIALTRWTFVGKVMSLLFNGLSRFVIDFLPRSKHLLILWVQSLSAVILETKKVKTHCFHFFHICLPHLFNKIPPLQWVLRSRVFSLTLWKFASLLLITFQYLLGLPICNLNVDK